jgi:CBS domain-containing protein
METVRELLAKKGGKVFSVRPNATVFEALEMMADRNIGAVLVVDDSGEIQGLFSERDYARKNIIKGKSTHATRVRDMMTKRILYVQPDSTIHDCMQLMTEKRVRHLPVLENGKLTGMVSIGDVVKDIISLQENVISQQAFQIDQLERYISGSL